MAFSKLIVLALLVLSVQGAPAPSSSSSASGSEEVIPEPQSDVPTLGDLGKSGGINPNGRCKIDDGLDDVILRIPGGLNGLRPDVRFTVQKLREVLQENVNGHNIPQLEASELLAEVVTVAKENKDADINNVIATAIDSCQTKGLITAKTAEKVKNFELNVGDYEIQFGSDLGSQGQTGEINPNGRSKIDDGIYDVILRIPGGLSGVRPDLRFSVEKLREVLQENVRGHKISQLEASEVLAEVVTVAKENKDADIASVIAAAVDTCQKQGLITARTAEKVKSFELNTADYEIQYGEINPNGRSKIDDGIYDVILRIPGGLIGVRPDVRFSVEKLREILEENVRDHTISQLEASEVLAEVVTVAKENKDADSNAVIAAAVDRCQKQGLITDKTADKVKNFELHGEHFEIQFAPALGDLEKFGGVNPNGRCQIDDGIYDVPRKPSKPATPAEPPKTAEPAPAPAPSSTTQKPEIKHAYYEKGIRYYPSDSVLAL